MKFLLRATIRNPEGNTMVKDPNMGKMMEDIMSFIKPEAAYFALENGEMTVYFVVNINDSSELPTFVEPFWLKLKAKVDLIPCMSQADFGKAQPNIQAAIKKFG